MAGVPTTCYRAPATGLKFRAEQWGPGENSDRMMVTRPTTQLLLCLMPSLLQESSHLISTECCEAGFTLTTSSAFMWRAGRLIDMKGIAQDHSVTRQHLHSNHSSNLILHALDHHSMMFFFFLKGQGEAQFSKQEPNLRGQSCKGEPSCRTRSG